MRPLRLCGLELFRKTMSASIDPKSMVAFMGKASPKGCSMTVGCVFIVCSTGADESSRCCPWPIIILYWHSRENLNIRNSTGTMACALFDSPVGFPIEFLHYATHITVIEIREEQARCDFLDIQPEPTRLPSFMMKI